ncbi:MAG: hypothetical protein ABIM49_06740 [candidate division WOR-3 bacterium]
MKVINKGEEFQNLKKQTPCKIKYCNEYVCPPSTHKPFKFLYCKKFCWGGYVEKDTFNKKIE